MSWCPRRTLTLSLRSLILMCLVPIACFGEGLLHRLADIDHKNLLLGENSKTHLVSSLHTRCMSILYFDNASTFIYIYIYCMYIYIYTHNPELNLSIKAPLLRTMPCSQAVTVSQEAVASLAFHAMALFGRMTNTIRATTTGICCFMKK